MCVKGVPHGGPLSYCEMLWVNPCSCFIQFNNISLDHYNLLLWSCLDVDNPSIYIGTGIVHLCLCHATRTIYCVSCFDDISVKLEYLHLGSSQSCWIQVTDQNNASMIIGAAPISSQIIAWGTNALLLIMRAIIETKGLFKLFKLFFLVRFCPRF